MRGYDTRNELKTPAIFRERSMYTRVFGIAGCVMWACLFFSPGAVFAVNPQTLDIAVRSLAAAQAPRMVGDVLLLTLKPGTPTRFVGARFAHESWKERT